MMNSVERISTLIPSFKLQLVFLEEREKLFKTISDSPMQGADALSNTATNYQSLVTSSTNSTTSSTVPVDSQSLSFTRLNTLNTVHSSELSVGDSAAHRSNLDVLINTMFPDDYKIPPLPNGLIKDVEDGSAAKFGPHCTNRRILIDVVVHDLIHKYNLFYPTHKQFDRVGSAIVKFLKLPLTIENVAIWKDALQTKLKRKRSEFPNNHAVQEYRLKYSKSGSGRPVKRKIGTTAQRDRYKQMMMVVSPSDTTSDEIRSKADQLRNMSQMEIQSQLRLWRETLYFRRESIRDRSTADVLNEYRGYGNPLLIFEEVHILMKINLVTAVRRQIPYLLEKFIDIPMFITDSPPIRLIKILCHQFEETIQHTICTTDPPTPYPTLVCTADGIDVHVDFIPIVSTQSPDDALALLIAMYTIFELSFDKKSRAIRLLYSVLHSEKRFLSNSVRHFMKEKNIDVFCEQKHQLSSSSSDLQSCGSTAHSSVQSQLDSNLGDESADQHSSSVSETIQNESSSNIHGSNANTVINADENNAENTSDSFDCLSQSQPMKQRKRQKKDSSQNNHDEAIAIDARKNKNLHSISDPLPLNDMTNLPSTSTQNKRRRRN